MRRFAPAITIAFALVTPAQAAPAQAWAIDKALSTVSFSSSFDGGAFNGSFSRWTGDIRFDPANLAGSSAVVTFDMTSAVTG
ncbi:MAG: YceI family protein, partial [Reyranella sp.]|nr:YceI family protein [Reyranella sp.]